MRHWDFKITLMAMAMMAFASASAAIPGIWDSVLKKEVKNINDFSAIELTGGIDIEYTQEKGEKPRATIYAMEDLMDLVDVTTQGGVLKVKEKRTDKMRLWKGKKIWKLVVTGSSSLNRVSVVGSGDVDLNGKTQGESISLTVTGSGDIDASHMRYNHITARVTGSGNISIKNMDVTNLVAKIGGSGDISLNGYAERADLSVNGSGDIDAEDLNAKVVIANVDGSGDISCRASRELNASVGGSGEIEYEGNPSVVHKSGKKHSIRMKL